MTKINQSTTLAQSNNRREDQELLNKYRPTEPVSSPALSWRDVHGSDEGLFSDHFIPPQGEQEWKRVGPPLLTINIRKTRQEGLTLELPQIPATLDYKRRVDIEIKGYSNLTFQQTGKEDAWNNPFTSESFQILSEVSKQCLLLQTRFPRSKILPAPDVIWVKDPHQKELDAIRKKLAQNPYSPLLENED